MFFPGEREEKQKTLFDEVVEISKNKLKKNPQYQDGLFDLEEIVDEVKLSIRNFCNIYYIPEQLKYVWVNMVVEVINYALQNNAVQTNTTANNALGSPQKITVGDTSVDLSTQTATTAIQKGYYDSLQDRLGSVILDYKSQLYKFRSLI